MIGDRNTKLSNNQHQHITITHKLLHTPKLLILNKTTNTLDSKSKRTIQTNINQLKNKITIIIIAHHLSTIRGTNHVYMLTNNKIIETNTFNKLATHPNNQFHHMIKLQIIAN